MFCQIHALACSISSRLTQSQFCLYHGYVLKGAQIYIGLVIESESLHSRRTYPAERLGFCQTSSQTAAMSTVNMALGSSETVDRLIWGKGLPSTLRVRLQMRGTLPLNDSER